jgi:hypothetical protein
MEQHLYTRAMQAEAPWRPVAGVDADTGASSIFLGCSVALLFAAVTPRLLPCPKVIIIYIILPKIDHVIIYDS